MEGRMAVQKERKTDFKGQQVSSVAPAEAGAAGSLAPCRWRPPPSRGRRYDLLRRLFDHHLLVDARARIEAEAHHHPLEKFQRFAVIVGVARRCDIFLAEFGARGIIGAIPELVAHVADRKAT